MPAKGRQQALLSTKAFGRYAVIVKSPQGTAIQLVDRMAGPGEMAGMAGEEDGRIDLILDRGLYKIVTHGPGNGQGNAQLEVRAFKERNGPKPPMLVELKPIDDFLDDFEQRSYWLEVKERRWVALEAAGRNLSDLRLWKDGSWLVDAVPHKVVLEPKVGQPLLACRLAVNLEPGLYLLTAYGGKGQPWAEDAKEHPFHLRFGIPALGTAGRRREVVSPFGVDRWLVPGDATYFRIELPEAGPASFTVGNYTERDPFSEGTDGGAIRKNSVPPVAETDVSGRGGNAYHLVTVKAVAGQPFVLQHFERSTEYRFETSGPYWISTIHTGQPGDAVDATGIVSRTHRRHGMTREPFLAQVIELDSAHAYARRANLLDSLTVFLYVKEGGSYEILSRGAEAKFRIEPFFTRRPERYESPDLAGSGSVWSLDAGYHVLTVVPVKKGILDMVVRPVGLVNFILDRIGSDKGVAEVPVRAALRFPEVMLDREYSYTLYLNLQPEVRAGAVLRPLPVDLRNPLPLTQKPGETVTVPIRAGERGAVRARAEDGSFLDVSLDGGPWVKAATAEVGAHSVAVRNPGKNAVVASLSLEPFRLWAETPLPALPDAALAVLPAYPVLDEREPRSFDLHKEGAATFLVRPEKPGLYRLETTGLLETEGNLRSRTVTSLDRKAANGVGRNFLVQQYLREGEYQVTVSARGESAGHAGLRLNRTDPVGGGDLAEGIPARITLPAGQAVTYTFTIKKKGRFRLQSLGAGRTFNCRLEDADGWPVEKPDIAASFERLFVPGRYRIVLLPEAVEGRRVTLLDRVPSPPSFKGHGPHILPLERGVDHVWREPPAGRERTPDRWTFDLPATAEVSIELTGEMEGSLFLEGEGGSNIRIGQVPPGRGWKGTLRQGRYRLDAVCSRKNNRLDYRVGVHPKEMLPGLSRTLSAPAVIPLSVPPAPDGTAGPVELWSYGSADVRARLYDGNGRLVARDDDRPDDWNFQIARRLPAGMYTLQVEPGGVLSPPRRSYRSIRNVPLRPREGRAQEDVPTPAPGEDSEESRATPVEEDTAAEVAFPTPEKETEPAVGVSEPSPIPESPAEGVSGIPEEEPATPYAVLPVSETVLHFDVRHEIVKPAITVPAQVDVRPGSTVHLYPLDLPAGAEILLLSARSEESAGLALEIFSSGGAAAEWKTVASTAGRQVRIELPVSHRPEGSGGGVLPAQYRMRVWSADRRENPVRIDASAPVPTAITEETLSKGITLDKAKGATSPVGIARVLLDRPGVFLLSGVRWSPGGNVPCREADGSPAEATGATLWLVKEIASGKTASSARIVAPRLVLPTGTERRIALALPADNTVVIDLASSGPGPVFSVATSRTGQPGIRVTDRSSGPASVPYGMAMAIGPRSAASVSLSPRDPVAVLWSAEAGEDPFPMPLEVRIHQIAFPPPDRWTLSPGATSGALPAGSARAFDLPKGAIRLRLALGEQLVGVLSRNDDVTGVLWAGGEPYEETLSLSEKDANRLTLLQPSASEGRFAVELLPRLPQDVSILRPGENVEKTELESGVWRLPVSPGQDADGNPFRVHVRGAVVDSFLVTSEGRVLRGADIHVPSGGGTLFSRHGRGLLLAWMDRHGGDPGDPWTEDGPPKISEVTIPSRVALDGKAQLLRISVSEPSVVHLRAVTPAITVVKRGKGGSGNAEETAVEVHPDGAALDLFLPAGPVEIGLRALAGRVLEGEATLTATSVTPIGEGLGPEVLLPAGRTRVFSFRVKRKGPVGIGVRADADVVESTLLDGSGKRIGTGAVQMPLLSPGNYLIQLKAPADGPPLRARPALAGVEPPGTGPPPEVLSGYLEKAKAGEAPAGEPDRYDEPTGEEGGRP